MNTLELKIIILKFFYKTPDRILFDVLFRVFRFSKVSYLIP